MQSHHKYATISPALQEFRIRLLNYAIDHPGPITDWEAKKIVGEVKNLHPSLPMDPIYALKQLRILKKVNGAITYLYPLSTEPTIHSVRLEDGRSFHAMCAIDAMGAAVTWNQTVRVESQCYDDGTPVKLTLSPDQGFLSVSPDDQLFVSYFDTVAEYRDFNC